MCTYPDLQKNQALMVKPQPCTCIHEGRKYVQSSITNFCLQNLLNFAACCGQVCHKGRGLDQVLSLCLPPGGCWFCLANPEVEKHLIIAMHCMETM